MINPFNEEEKKSRSFITEEDLIIPQTFSEHTKSIMLSPNRQGIVMTVPSKNLTTQCSKLCIAP